MRTRPMEERFWEKVHKTEDCWVWTASTSRKGYGHIGTGIGNKMVPAHRYSYELRYGPVAEGLVIDHMCHNRACVNPDHLRAITNKQNCENAGGAQSDSKSGVRGVFWSTDRNKWRAQVRHNGRLINAGCFGTLEEADAAVKAKRNELFTHNDYDRRTA